MNPFDKKAIIAKTTYKVCTGVPSWHQKRAGHSYAGMLTLELTEEEKEAYRKNHLAATPGGHVTFIPVPKP